ncbi:MAG: RNA polymerase sigma factor [Thermoanaerobaculia bacterium]
MAEDPESIEALVGRFQEGIDREESFRRIFGAYYPRIQRFFLAKGFSSEESNDLTQESLFRIYRSLPTFRSESHFGRWAFEVSRHIYLNEIRRRGAFKRDGLEQSLDVVPSGDLVGGEPDALGEAISREEIQIMQAALNELPEQMRRCCILRYEKGLKYQEIATVMNISIQAVKSHLYQARKRLQGKLGEAEKR